MGKFLNTEYTDTLDSLTEQFKTNLKNTFYTSVIETNPMTCTYYNQNVSKSLLDGPMEVNYSNLGENSGIKFNKINNFLLYGIDPMQLSTDDTEFGLESGNIQGEGTILPNTIRPIDGDYFVINHADRKIFFKVNKVNMDTLANGANYYKIEFNLECTDDIEGNIESQVVNTYNTIYNNIGTDIKCIIEDTNFEFIETMETFIDNLKDYYVALFFYDKIQTFYVSHNGYNFYDAYLIEFLKRNKILAGGSKFLYIDHQLTVNKTFAIDYEQTVFRAVEKCDKNKIPITPLTAMEVKDRFSLLSTRPEKYYSIEYGKNNTLASPIYPLPVEVITHIMDNTLYEDPKLSIWNIIIDYFNNQEMKDDLKNNIEESINYYRNDISLFYAIPMIIFIIESKIKDILNEEHKINLK